MAGTIDQSIDHIKMMLARIDLNPLELGLLERYMKDPDTVEKNMTDLLTKILAKNEQDKYKTKYINKVLPLFAKHIFWDT
jgi:hypothetical protein